MQNYKKKVQQTHFNIFCASLAIFCFLLVGSPDNPKNSKPLKCYVCSIFAIFCQKAVPEKFKITHSEVHFVESIQDEALPLVKTPCNTLTPPFNTPLTIYSHPPPP